MRAPLLLPVALVALTLVAAGLGRVAVSGQVGTPGPVASPLASPVACSENASPGRLVAVPNKVTINLTDDGFDPARVQTTNNTALNLTLINTGTRPHSFVLDDYDLRIELAPGESHQLDLTPIDYGDAVTHWFTSDAPGDECMQGKIIFYI